MSSPSHRPWTLYLVTFLAALLAAGSGTYWVLGTVGLAANRAPSAAVALSVSPPETKDLARVLGADLAPQVKPVELVSTQYQLLGVVAGPVGKGYALLVIGGAPPKAYTVGSALVEGQVLQSVSARGAKIGASLQSEAAIELSLPKPPGS